MSREDFKKFIIAAERSPSIKNDLKKCKNQEGLFHIANKYHFNLTPNDLKEEVISSHIANWFDLSKISPINKY
tara:strand:- start:2507 stop:2725 length:219 start_codon:yes stop_codon:yes gene_type:complete